MNKVKFNYKKTPIFNLSYRAILSICLFLGPYFLTAQLVYEVSNFGNIKYHEVETPNMADIIVYKAPNSIYPGIDKNEGIWFFCQNQSMAKLTVQAMPFSIEADLNVYFTKYPIIAKWINEEKKKWFTTIRPFRDYARYG